MKKKVQYELIGIGVGTVVIVAVVVVVYMVTLNQKYAIKESETTVEVPPPLPIVDNSYKPTVTDEACLASPTELKTCIQQRDCLSCQEKPGNATMQCVTIPIDGDPTVDSVTQQLVTPYEFAISASDPAVECNGNGLISDYNNKCVCTGNALTDDEWYTGTTCDVRHFRVHTPGQYCVPAYVNQCDSNTSDIDLTGVLGADTGSWSCECKAGYSAMFAQTTEGASCNEEIACNAQQPQLDSNGAAKKFSVFSSYDDVSGEPQFENKIVYPDRLVTAGAAPSETCVVPTKSRVVDSNTPRPYTEFIVDPLADPTCIPLQYSNLCTVSSGDTGVVHTIRGSQRQNGSNLNGDELHERVSPPYAPPPPPGLQACPDTWTGDGTSSSPCVDPKNTKNTLTLYSTNKRDWVGGITGVADLKASKTSANVAVSSLAWKTLNASKSNPTVVSDPICTGQASLASYSDTYDAASDTGYPIETSFCVGSTCSGGSGIRTPKWNSKVDGSLLTVNREPPFVNGISDIGGVCGCDSTSVDGVPSRPAYSYPGGVDNKYSWWKCATDSCWSSEFPQGKINSTTNICNCPTENLTANGLYNTAISYAPTNEPPRCLKDPCNPGGYSTNRDVSKNVLQCSADTDCRSKTICYKNACYLSSEFTCPAGTDAECDTHLPLWTGSSACVAGACYFKDIEREAAGATCSCEDGTECTACEMGRRCETSETSSTANVCSPYCVCGPGYEQVLDQSALDSYRCQKLCDPDACLNGGECTVKNNVRSCNCLPCFGGDFCETWLGDPSKKGQYPPGTQCEADSDCCTTFCKEGIHDLSGVEKYCADPIWR